MAEITLKATATAMAMILGLAMALAVFISYGTSAVRGARADVQGPLDCMYSGVSRVTGSAFCGDSPPIDSLCLQVYATHPAGGDQRLASLVHLSYIDEAMENVTFCYRKYCTNGEVATQLTAESEHDIHTEVLLRDNSTFACLIDSTQPGHVFVVHRDRKQALSKMNFSRLEAALILTAPSLILLAICIGLAVCCHRKLLKAEAVVKGDVTSYVKIGDKYYARKTDVVKAFQP